MLQFPSEWSHQFGANIATALPPGLGARFRYFERLAPQPGFAQIVDRMLATDPEFRVHEVGEMVRVVTVEGEYGAWVAIEGRREGGKAMRYIGAAFLDDFATALDVVAIIPQHFGNVGNLAFELTRAQRFELTRRPRRFFYVPPPDWHALPSGLTASWYPLDFPRNLTTLVVPPAHAFEGDPHAAIDAVLDDAGAGLAIEDHARETLTSVSGVPGSYVRVTGRRAGRDERIYRDTAAYAVAPYIYHLRLETTNARALLDLREQFSAVARSFRPLPLLDEMRIGRAFAAMSSDSFSHWTS